MLRTESLQDYKANNAYSCNYALVSDFGQSPYRLVAQISVTIEILRCAQNDT